MQAPGEVGLTASLADWTRLRSDATAISDASGETSFGALSQRVTQALLGLKRAGICAGDRVAVLGRNHGSQLVLLFACAQMNAVLVPLNWRLAPPELGAVLDDAAPTILLVAGDLAGVVMAAGVVPSERLLVSANDDLVEPLLDFSGAAVPAAEGLGASSPGDLMLCYTSGSTGAPSGVRLTHTNLWAAAMQMRGWPPARWRDGSISLCALPLFHIAGLRAALFPILFGGAAVFVPDQNPATILEMMARHRVEKLSIVPTMLSSLIRYPSFDPASLKALETVFYGGAPMPLTLVREVRQKLSCDLVQIYGLTETTGAACAQLFETGDEGRQRGCGRPLPGLNLAVRSEDGRPVPPGQQGEVWLGGATLAAGYWNNDKKTADTFLDGWFKTGDLGTVDADGYVSLSGRKGDVIKSGGEKVAPTEVEEVLISHPAVLEVGVVGVADDHWGEMVSAAVVVRAGHSFDAAALERHCRAVIAAYKVPKRIFVVEALPRNANGKLVRAELRKRVDAMVRTQVT